MFNTYDIRSSALASKTLAELSGVSISTWKKCAVYKKEYEKTDAFLKKIINSYGHFPRKYTDLDFVYFHITTSANGCKAIKKYGILDLRQAYMCEESELRLFLNQHGVYIDLDNCCLTYNGSKYDISFHAGSCPRDNTKEYHCWMVGRKFYDDYATCGFLSVDQSPYGGQVHRRPEILKDIDNLLDLDLSGEWKKFYSPYEITAKVSGNDIVYRGDDSDDDRDRVLTYLTTAYDSAFKSQDEVVLLMKSGVQILPKRVMRIEPIAFWV